MITSSPRNRASRPHVGAHATGALAASIASLFGAAIVILMVHLSWSGALFSW